MQIVRYMDEETSALYIDGVLDKVGDHYIIEDRLGELLKVELVNSDAFFMGGNDYDAVAKTVDEIHTYEIKLESNEEDEAIAQDLERQAAELAKQATDLLEKAKQIRK